MPLASYRRVLAVPAARSALLLGIFVRIPMFAGGVVLTLHVVQTLGRGYGAAGLATAAATVAMALSGPWRGRLLDRVGLRRTLVPTLAVTGVCWSVAPFVGYLPLLVLAAVAGLFVVPTFSVIRQAMITAVPEQDRRTALSLDAVAVELSFMVGPVIGVWAATAWSTSWVLFAVEMVGLVAGAAIWWVNPPTSGDHTGEESAPTRRSWFTSPLVAVLAAAAVSTVILSGTDVALVAALREFGAVPLLGPTLALWGFGSIVGGLVYGALRRPLPVFGLLAGLGVVTLPLAFAAGPWPLAWLTVLAGLFCAPTITATVDAVSRLVPDRARGEAMGWHGSAMTAGSALGAPIAGVAIDRAGSGAGFTLVAVIGIAVAGAGTIVAGALGERLRRPAEASVQELSAHVPDAGSPGEGSLSLRSAGQALGSGDERVSSPAR
jgi:MFS family permease